MQFSLSQHAQGELQKRRIPIHILELILEYPEQILEEDGLKVYQGTFKANNDKTYLLRAYINDLVQHNIIVTVYVTSKIKKYWRLDNGS
ncbi:DUF4258 domain-containing protein [Crocosphaera sp. UHCC 0190]|uniref:DUF4258 domain-containing protein n=1 Tax=Crocosphaera sp. UHCC 0190 TaxID=3110246 RepID=UPI002B214AE7|nr:DUF4258 domain-containing protein [Crocosphaera sp. UHCC 0190]MEA5509314.1 DUF4258 domain-containing protein [Crocosphaera sp. UHCC 0190]